MLSGTNGDGDVTPGAEREMHLREDAQGGLSEEKTYKWTPQPCEEIGTWF